MCCGAVHTPIVCSFVLASDTDGVFYCVGCGLPGSTEGNGQSTAGATSQGTTVCGTNGCTLPDRHAGLCSIPPLPSRRAAAGEERAEDEDCEDVSDGMSGRTRRARSWDSFHMSHQGLWMREGLSAQDAQPKNVGMRYGERIHFLLDKDPTLAPGDLGTWNPKEDQPLPGWASGWRPVNKQTVSQAATTAGDDEPGSVFCSLLMHRI